MYIRGQEQKQTIPFTFEKGMIVIIDGKYALRKQLRDFTM